MTQRDASSPSARPGSARKRRRRVRSEPRLTQAMENYLLSIFLVEEQGLRVTNSNLVDQLRRVPETEYLGTSLPSVSGMLRRMEKEGFIQIGDTREIALTNRGRLLAERMIRRHRLAARMIVDLLGMDLHVVNAQAHMLEHAMSEDLEKTIASRLGHPEVDPFGQPIPGSSYKPRKDVTTLDHAAEQSTVVIDRIPEEDEDLIKYLVECGVLPGVEVTVQEVAPYRGVVGIKVGDQTAVLGYGVAGRIHVRPA